MDVLYEGSLKSSVYFDITLYTCQVTIRWPDQRREERGINLVVYGDTENRTRQVT